MKNLIYKFHFVVLFLFFINGCTNNDKTTGFWQEWHNETPINTGIQRTGKQVYDFKCYECHTKNTQGAPMPGDNYEWNRRYQKGIDVLIKHTIEGFNRGVMPKRGGCRDCSEQELKNAIIYMLNKSGITVKVDKKYELQS